MNSSNLAYVSKITEILDGNIETVDNITKLIVADADMNTAIGKNDS